MSTAQHPVPPSRVEAQSGSAGTQELFFPPYSKQRLSLVRMVLDLMTLPMP